MTIETIPQTADFAFELDSLDAETRSEVLARAFWALGHPVRMRIVTMLMDEGEKTVGELSARLPVSQPQVSAHLKCLTECGFLTVRRSGRRSFYRTASPWLAGLLSLMGDHADTYCAQLLECVGCSPAQVSPRRGADTDPVGVSPSSSSTC